MTSLRESSSVSGSTIKLILNYNDENKITYINTEATGLKESNPVCTFDEFVDKTKDRFNALANNSDLLVRFKFTPLLRQGDKS